MATLVGVLMVIGGVAVLAIVRPWRPEPPDEEPEVKRPTAKRPQPRRPRPKPGAVAQRHRVETITRTRRVPPEPGREEILLPEWLGPVSGPR